MNHELTYGKLKEALDILRGAVMIVYPMGLPPHDPIKAEFDNAEDLSGMQVGADWLTSLRVTVARCEGDHIGTSGSLTCLFVSAMTRSINVIAYCRTVM